MNENQHPATPLSVSADSTHASSTLAMTVKECGVADSQDRYTICKGWFPFACGVFPRSSKHFRALFDAQQGTITQLELWSGSGDWYRDEDNVECIAQLTRVLVVAGVLQHDAAEIAELQCAPIEKIPHWASPADHNLNEVRLQFGRPSIVAGRYLCFESPDVAERFLAAAREAGEAKAYVTSLSSVMMTTDSRKVVINVSPATIARLLGQQTKVGAETDWKGMADTLLDVVDSLIAQINQMKGIFPANASMIQDTLEQADRVADQYMRASLVVGGLYSDWQMDGSEVQVLEHERGATMAKCKLIHSGIRYHANVHALRPVKDVPDRQMSGMALIQSIENDVGSRNM